MNKGIVEVSLKDAIIELLGKSGMSINGLYKALAERNIKIHRLTLTGYLIAMRDMGILKERNIKPAKVFSVVATKKRDIYQIIGEISKMINEENASDICLYSLNRLFNRPIFLRELNHAGVGTPRSGRKVAGDERKNALKMVSDAGITVPRNNSAFIPDKEYVDEFNQILFKLILDEYKIKGTVNRDVKQKKLDCES